MMSREFEVKLGRAAELFEEIRARRPLVQMIPNTVSAALCADGLSALGARPLMAVEPLEMEEITRQADVCVINLGQPDQKKIEAARVAIHEGIRTGKPLVLDPVGCGASRFRLMSVQELLALPWQGIVKGNVSELYSIQTNRLTREGIDAIEKRELTMQVPKGRIYLATGEPDLVICDGKQFLLPHHRINHFSQDEEEQKRYNIVGSGCLAGAVAGACHSVETDAVSAAAAASLGMAFALEYAAKASGYGGAKMSLLDGLGKLSVQEFSKWLEHRIDAFGN